ncbi:TPA: hypothetical protein DCE37_17315, partial [Candidatus Latescibacteria bacterium]|nr:hypothetical protein [Candidatus Latescibacterota bacterium]
MEVVVKQGRRDKLISKEMRAGSLIPVLAYDPTNQLFLNDDQTLGFAFLCEPLTYGDEKIQERVSGLLN